MNQKRPVAHNEARRGRGGFLARLLLKIRWLFSRLTGREAKKNPNVYPLY